ncbi:MAG: DUF455 family protein [Gemmatimonadetes bacterium]|jgi:uncharacterized ferritin-like protein (DUF455 family)|nr:DUF455 family protein [Gemmatimonadota bacterium]MBT6146103.1 DUF455 family protein [Gemmatimonadota bacterium]MBT7863530.1 DUF455 family protein [Gemmatimonadota bacterium]
MEIRDLAERVLFGTTLEEKLVQAGRLVDTQPGKAVTTPDTPGRPPELALGRWNESQRASFPDVRALERDQERGLVLHFFANHELLAAELMALVLLKFPDAPPKFRRGVAQTMRDEQEHVRLYLARMAVAGVHFGQIPVSDFFWKAIAPMPSPMDYVARLCLTLEQANLDYAPHYQQLFGQVGDPDTSALLGRIYRDEIGHVKYGLNWFNTWREPTRSAFDSFEQVLGFPLSPSRAKGIGFNREGRLAAGFTPDFIDELEVFAHSHGRCPYLWWFNPLCDLVAGRDALFTPPQTLLHLSRDLAMVPALLAANDDIVLVPERPPVAFLKEWKHAGLPLPELIEWDPLSPVLPEADVVGHRPPQALIGRRLTGLCPWGWAPDSVQRLAPLAVNLPEGEVTPRALWSPARRDLYRKSWSARWLGEVIATLQAEEGEWIGGPETVGAPYESVEAVEEGLRAGFAAGWRQALMKTDFGTAGGQLMQVEAPGAGGGAGGDADGRKEVEAGGDPDSDRDDDGALLLDHQRGWVRGQLQDAGAIVVEPWLDRVLDISAQYDVEADGSIRLLGITRFLTDTRGRFEGVFVHNTVAGLDKRLCRFLYGDGRDGRRLQRIFARLGDLLLKRLPADFRGPVGIDAFIYRTQNDELRLKPIVEVNPRYTMGRVGVALRKRVLTSRTAVWRLQRLRDLSMDVDKWAGDLRARLPLEMTADGHQISGGVVFTNDPTTAKSCVGVLVVAKGIDPAMFGAAGGAETSPERSPD